MPRIAVLDRDRCKPGDCRMLCMRVCPKVRTGDETITVDEDSGKPVISEILCSGCGICVKKCPYGALSIINLPEELSEPIHQYGVNGFRIFNLPTPKDGVVGIVGSNGIGKTTVLKILAGELKPNLGGDARWDEVLERFRGNEIQNYLSKLADGTLKAVYKPQYVESIPRIVKGSAGDVLKQRDELGKLGELTDALGLDSFLNKKVDSLSGGELQKLAIAACLIREADVYLLDEPSSYLDVRERLNVARTIRSLSDSNVFVIEHDLVVLDYLSDYVHILYGKSGAYGVVSNIKGVRVGLNEYLSGFLKSENVRFRGELSYTIASPNEAVKRRQLVEYPILEKKYPGFDLIVEGSLLYKPQVLGILGPNATGKTTFVKMLADVVSPDNIKLDIDMLVSYKPQYIKTSSDSVNSLKLNAYFIEKLNLSHLLASSLDELSGGELQRVALADCLSKKADLYLLDEPSAYLDVEERLRFAKILTHFAQEKKTTVLVVDHDILLLDYLSDELMVFSGKSGVEGSASGSLSLRDGMNLFLKQMDVSFRRDIDSGRPRANKPGSVKDREQKSTGEYYYIQQS
ncbi:MAG: ribosome biogenesis/translation initiation ATPase RLI [Candidatus Altiarchaeales archaeon ex4484_96]|nr:MAG: ribosome biogenesis/translation initiation ATPase RLI [Candidatus Altiarchaeales archaeon ex4484_96]